MSMIVRSVLRCLVLFALVFGCAGALGGCGLFEHSKILNPKTGPGTDYPCQRADDVYCGEGRGPNACCHAGEVCRPDRCDATAYNGNREWIGSARGAGSHPRVPSHR
jgi:hypothetical protein